MLIIDVKELESYGFDLCFSDTGRVRTCGGVSERAAIDAIYYCNNRRSRVHFIGFNLS